MSCNIAHEAGIIILEHLDIKGEKANSRANCDPERHQEKAEVQRVEKRKEITAGKKSGTMERQSEEGSLNCNKPRARQKSLKHTHTHTHHGICTHITPV